MTLQGSNVNFQAGFLIPPFFFNHLQGLRIDDNFS